LFYFKFEPSNADFIIGEKGDINYWWVDIGCSSLVYVRFGGNQPPQVEGVWLWRISGGIHMDLIWNIHWLYSNKRIVIYGFDENSEDCKYFLVVIK